MLARTALAAALLLVAAAGAPTRAGDDDGPGRRSASPAVDEAQPIEALLARFHADFGSARILGLELDEDTVRDQSIAVYEIKALTAHGTVLRIIYDAKTLQKISVSGERRERGDDDDNDDNDDDD